MRSHLWMGLGLAAGLIVGLVAAVSAEPGLVNAVQRLRPVGVLFLNLLQMVVIPLVMTALFAGIAKLGKLRAVGRLVLRTLAFFWGTAIAAILIGFIVASLILPLGRLSPEKAAALRQAATVDSAVVQKTAADIPTAARFIVELVPANPFKAAADGNLLPVVVFMTFFGLAAAALPDDKRTTLINLADAVTEALIRIVHWVLLLAPLGIFALVAPLVARYGPDILNAMLWFVVAELVGVAIYIAAVYLPTVAFLARVGPRRFLRGAFPAILTGASTTSSMAALPTMLDAADKDFHLPRPIAGFTLPLGASMNRGGSALYQAVAVLFIAQLYGVPLGFGDLFQAGAAVFLASLTVAAVPSGSVVSLLPAFSALGLPIQGLSILIGLDRIPDMLRTGTNVAGHLSGAVVIAAVEGEQRE